jgi:hypothetical protein
MYITHVLIFLIPILSQNDRDDNKNNIAYLSFFWYYRKCICNIVINRILSPLRMTLDNPQSSQYINQMNKTGMDEPDGVVNFWRYESHVYVKPCYRPYLFIFVILAFSYDMYII